MADHGYLLMAEMVHRALNVTADGDQVIGLDRFWCLGSTVTAHFRGKNPVTLSRQRSDLMAPRVPALGKSVQQPDWLAALGACDMHTELNAVDLDQLLLCLLHTALH